MKYRTPNVSNADYYIDGSLQLCRTYCDTILFFARHIILI